MNWFEQGQADARRGWQCGTYGYAPPGEALAPETIAYGYGYFHETGRWHGRFGRRMADSLILGPNTRHYYLLGFRVGTLAGAAATKVVEAA